jgi:2,3-diketo-5-methylthio-1-phosphopentane phosphatase
MPYPSALAGNPKMIFFTDFDGTITLQDTNDFMTDTLGMGPERRKALNRACLLEERTFRSTFTEMLDSIRTPFPACLDLLRKNISLDPKFQEFFLWARGAGVPVVILSSGMEAIIRMLMEHLLGAALASEIEIISNQCVARGPGVSIDQPGGWTIEYHDDSGFGHDKSIEIRKYVRHFADGREAERPVYLYAGDGVSDLSAARETDLLFAKKGRDLVTYCEREGVPFTVFEDWGSILGTTRDIFEGKTSVKKVAQEGREEVKSEGMNGEVKTTH